MSWTQKNDKLKFYSKQTNSHYLSFNKNSRGKKFQKNIYYPKQKHWLKKYTPNNFSRKKQVEFLSSLKKAKTLEKEVLFIRLKKSRTIASFINFKWTTIPKKKKIQIFLGLKKTFKKVTRKLIKQKRQPKTPRSYKPKIRILLRRFHGIWNFSVNETINRILKEKRKRNQFPFHFTKKSRRKKRWYPFFLNIFSRTAFKISKSEPNEIFPYYKPDWAVDSRSLNREKPIASRYIGAIARDGKDYVPPRYITLISTKWTPSYNMFFYLTKLWKNTKNQKTLDKKELKLEKKTLNKRKKIRFNFIKIINKYFINSINNNDIIFSNIQIYKKLFKQQLRWRPHGTYHTRYKHNTKNWKYQAAYKYKKDANLKKKNIAKTINAKNKNLKKAIVKINFLKYKLKIKARLKNKPQLKKLFCFLYKNKYRSSLFKLKYHLKIKQITRPFKKAFWLKKKVTLKKRKVLPKLTYKFFENFGKINTSLHKFRKYKKMGTAWMYKVKFNRQFYLRVGYKLSKKLKVVPVFSTSKHKLITITKIKKLTTNNDSQKRHYGKYIKKFLKLQNINFKKFVINDKLNWIDPNLLRRFHRYGFLYQHKQIFFTQWAKWGILWWPKGKKIWNKINHVIVKHSFRHTQKNPWSYYKISWWHKKTDRWLNPIMHNRQLFPFQLYTRVTNEKRHPGRRKRYKVYKWYLYTMSNKWEYTMRVKKNYRLRQILFGRIILPALNYLKKKQYLFIKKNVARVKPLGLQNSRPTIFLGKFERRIDILTYKLNFAPTVQWARSFVESGLIYVSYLNYRRTTNFKNILTKQQKFPLLTDWKKNTIFYFNNKINDLLFRRKMSFFSRHLFNMPLPVTLPSYRVMLKGIVHWSNQNIRVLFYKNLCHRFMPRYFLYNKQKTIAYFWRNFTLGDIEVLGKRDRMKRHTHKWLA